MSNELVQYEQGQVQQQPTQHQAMVKDEFQKLWDIACAFAQSDVIPDSYRNKPANCVVALGISKRLGMDISMVMNSLYIIKGKPSWSAQFIIAAVNASGRFSRLKFQMSGQGETLECFAWATDLETGQNVRGPSVTWAMAVKEGWTSKKDRHGNETSKWQSFPELMIQYRAATFFGRLHCPDILMGMHSVEENVDIANSIAPRTQSTTSKLLGGPAKEGPESINYEAAMGGENG